MDPRSPGGLAAGRLRFLPVSASLSTSSFSSSLSSSLSALNLDPQPIAGAIDPAEIAKLDVQSVIAEFPNIKANIARTREAPNVKAHISHIGLRDPQGPLGAHRGNK